MAINLKIKTTDPRNSILLAILLAGGRSVSIKCGVVAVTKGKFK